MTGYKFLDGLQFEYDIIFNTQVRNVFSNQFVTILYLNRHLLNHGDPARLQLDF